MKIGVFGTCRIDNFLLEGFQQTRSTYPYVFTSSEHTIHIRPLGYTTTTSDVLQNLRLIRDGTYTTLQSPFLLKNILKKHGGTTFFTDIDYDYLVLEICSLKKIIHDKSGYIFPYEVEGQCPLNSTYTYERETFDETVENIRSIQKLMNCPILLYPPIYRFSGAPVLGQHEDTPLSNVMEYRMEIIKRMKTACNGTTIQLVDWNHGIEMFGISKMVKDQFHFTDFAKKYNSKQIVDIMESKRIHYSNENVYFNIPKNNHELHRYYRMIEERDHCEKSFRLLIKYLYDCGELDNKKNIIDLGAWIGENSIPWSLQIDGVVYAIDPSLENIQYIKTLQYLNNIPNIQTYSYCVSDREKVVYTNNDLKHATFNMNQGKTQLKTTTLDILYKKKHIHTIGFIHLDVEGFEHSIIQGSLELLRKERPLLVWENHLDTDNYQETVQLLNTLDYDTYVINEYFPHCRSSCRNFISFPTSEDTRIAKINNHFKNTENKGIQGKEFLYKI